MILSQYFSFPLSLPLHQRSIPIHSPTTHSKYNVSLPGFQFSLSEPFRQRSINTHSHTTYAVKFSLQGLQVSLTVTFHHCSKTFIHLPPKLYNCTSVFPCQNHSNNAPYQSFNYNPRGIMLLSKHFRFPLSVPFHHCSIYIQLSSPNLYNYFSPNNSVFPCQYHSINAP